MEKYLKEIKRERWTERKGGKKEGKGKKEAKETGRDKIPLHSDHEANFSCPGWSKIAVIHLSIRRQ